jgi:hypothetical protein
MSALLGPHSWMWQSRRAMLLHSFGAAWMTGFVAGTDQAQLSRLPNRREY